MQDVRLFIQTQTNWSDKHFQTSNVSHREDLPIALSAIERKRKMCLIFRPETGRFLFNLFTTGKYYYSANSNGTTRQ